MVASQLQSMTTEWQHSNVWNGAGGCRKLALQTVCIMNVDCAVLVLISTTISVQGKIKDFVHKSTTSAK
jgi:hypothetical protein